ncbi:MAG: DUF4349 domain-containing protein [candidate division Zixibacteria bacterium]|nr:DUF4349 domain-containing protein [candidate division Zixibacteria bacterium]
MRESIIVVLALGLAFTVACKKGAEAPAVGEKGEPREGEAPQVKGLEFKRAENLPAGEAPPAPGGEELGAAEGARLLKGPVEGGPGKAAELKLIKTAELTCEVDDVNEGFEEVYAVAKAERATVAGTTRAVAEQGYAYGSITLKIHPSRYDETIRALRKIGRLLEENTATEDVTQEYTDLQARLGNAEAARARYLEILATRAGTVRDILDVEREIERVTENVERLKGQMRYLDSRIGLSTITVYLEEPHAAVPTVYNLGKAIKKAFRVAARICIFLIQAVIVLLPFIVILIALVVIVRLIIWYFQRRRRRAKQAVKGL